MIQTRQIEGKERRGLDPMNAKETFESFYTKKLQSLVIDLKAVIKGDVPYAVGPEYACRLCSGRIKLHTQGQILCMKCCMPPELMPATWSKDLKRCVFRILIRYPNLEECKAEWEASQVKRSHPDPQPRPRAKEGNLELGKRIQEARRATGLSSEDLARKIFKGDGTRISKSSILGYEGGWVTPPKHILEQIEKALGMDALQNASKSHQDGRECL